MQKFFIGILKNGKRIVKSAEQLESMKDFVNETNRIFGDELKII